MTKVGFPGLGIPEFEMNRIAFWIPDENGKAIYWYGIIICIGFIVAICYGLVSAKKSGISQDDFLDCAIATIPVSVIFARLFYVLTDADHTYESFLDVIAVWDGGISILGGIIGGVIAISAVCLIKKKSILNMLDLICKCLIIGQIIGRVGNFINGEVYGIETDLPWGMYVDGVGTVHPLFLYEMIWNSIGLVLLILLSKKKKFNGEVFFTYVAWYGSGRSLLELLRNKEFILGAANGVYVSHIVSAAAFIAASAALVVLFAKNKDKKAEEVYENCFSDTEKAENTDAENIENAGNTGDTESENGNID